MLLITFHEIASDVSMVRLDHQAFTTGYTSYRNDNGDLLICANWLLSWPLLQEQMELDYHGIYVPFGMTVGLICNVGFRTSFM